MGSGSGYSHYGKANSKKRILLLIILVLVIAGGLIAVKMLDDASRAAEPTGDFSARFTTPRVVTYNGKLYTYNDALSSYLLIGVDKTTADNQASGFRNGGQADFLMLLVVDSENETIQRIQIDRDTMTGITILGVLGNISGTRKAQICLSHGFGGSETQSCEFTVDAVEKLLEGIKIDGYVSLNMDGVPTMCDALGGVSVTLEDDLTMINPDWTYGSTVLLAGENAEKFVRARSEVGDGTNESRMRRQRAFLTAMNNTLMEKLKKNTKFGDLFFDSLLPYLTSDMKKGKILNEVNKAKNFLYGEMIAIKGEHIIGNDGFVEFHPDEDALRQMVLDVFFTGAPD